MSEDEARRITAQDEESDQDVEGHLHGRRVGVNDDETGESEGDEDFEAHMRRGNQPRRIQ